MVEALTLSQNCQGPPSVFEAEGHGGTDLLPNAHSDWLSVRLDWSFVSSLGKLFKNLIV